MRYNKQEQIKYQSDKLKYHFSRLIKLGLEPKEIFKILQEDEKEIISQNKQSKE